MLHTCLEELVRVGIIAPPFFVPASYADAFELTSSGSPSTAPEAAADTATAAVARNGPGATPTTPTNSNLAQPGGWRETESERTVTRDSDRGVRVDDGGDVMMDAEGQEGEDEAVPETGRTTGEEGRRARDMLNRGRCATLILPQYLSDWHHVTSNFLGMCKA